MGTKIFNGVGILSSTEEQWARRGDVLNMGVWGSLGYLAALMVFFLRNQHSPSSLSSIRRFNLRSCRQPSPSFLRSARCIIARRYVMAFNRCAARAGLQLLLSIYITQIPPRPTTVT